MFANASCVEKFYMELRCSLDIFRMIIEIPRSNEIRRKVRNNGSMLPDTMTNWDILQDFPAGFSSALRRYVWWTTETKYFNK